MFGFLLIYLSQSADYYITFHIQVTTDHPIYYQYVTQTQKRTFNDPDTQLYGTNYFVVILYTECSSGETRIGTYYADTSYPNDVYITDETIAEVCNPKPPPMYYLEIVNKLTPPYYLSYSEIKEGGPKKLVIESKSFINNNPFTVYLFYNCSDEYIFIQEAKGTTSESEKVTIESVSQSCPSTIEPKKSNDTLTLIILCSVGGVVFIVIIICICCCCRKKSKDRPPV